ncbi:MFS transporter [Sphingobium sp. KCTC 72723]|uniref:MFS transporter n=1 Tax=Sphingobium sp. KCTC 72723 TaxID=2733867 RepID=UPI00165E1EB0|nr:MFS transporter [Sphingobium sp. KCTC 72723]
MRLGHPLRTDQPSSPGTMRISRARLAIFTMPVLLFQAIEMAWRAYLPRFLTLDVGITLGLVGALMLGARLLDAVADPVLGWLSDTVRTPLGLRRPWMLAGALLVPAGALLLFLAPPGTALVQIVGASLLLHLGYSCIITPHGGWGLELSDDSHQRTRIMGAKVWFGLLGSLGLIAVMALMERSFAIARAGQMEVLGWVIAVLAPVTVLAVIMMFRERPDTDRPSTAVRPLALFAAILRDRSMRAILFLYMVTGIIDAAAAGSFLFLAEDALGLNGWGATLLLVQPVLALATLPVWSRISARIGRQRSLMIAYGWQAVTAPLIFFIPDGQPLVFAAFLAMRALGWGVDYMLLRAMVADLADRPSPRAARLGGTYYGMSSVTLKLAMGLGGGGALWLIDLMVRQSGTGTSDVAIRLAYALPAMVLAPIAVMRLGGHDRNTQSASLLVA